MSMLKYFFKRVLAMVPVTFGVMTLTFILSRMMPGDPVLAMLEAAGIAKPNPVVYNQMVRQLGLDQHIIIQYFKYIADLFTGNWGVSISIARNQNVWDLIIQRLPLTIDLALFSIIIASFLGIKAGVISSTHRNKPSDTIVRGLALVGVAIPVFFLGMLVQFILGYLIPIFPTTGHKDFVYANPEFVTGFYIIDSLISGEIYKIFDYLYHMILPVFCLSFITLAGITRQTRSSMLEVLQQDYVRTARAKGCKERDVVNNHALKNALIPTVTVIGLNFAALLTGAVLTESTFGLAGLGNLLINAITLKDYWVLSAVVFLITLIFIFATLITDLLYGILDPRIRY
ncbi:MAG: ABC transporter permease [Promethearchaeota archaeon]